MFTLDEIFAFISQHADDRPLLKDYYDKSYDSLKDLNKRSNLISFFILIIFALFSFSSYITEISVSGLKVTQAVVIIASPLLISYFLLEWCLIARRRREIMKILKHIGINIFGIPAVGADYDFRHFGLHSRNLLPFSFMIEFINVDVRSLFRFRLFQIILLLIFVSVGGYVFTALYHSANLFFSAKCIDLKTQIAIVLCNVLSLICLLQIVLFYVNEFQLQRRVTIADAEFISRLNNEIDS
jgi:hypothetical protein